MPPRPPRIEDVFSPRSPWHYVGFCLLSIGLNTFSSLVGTWGFVVCAPFLVLLFVLMWLRARRLLAAPVAYRVTKQPPLPARGLILLLSPYDPRSPNPELRDAEKVHVMIEALLENAERLTEDDLHKINLSGSNLAPQLEAVAYHVRQGQLRDVWLLTTATEWVEADGVRRCVRGSEKAAELLEACLRLRHGAALAVQRVGLTVPAWDYAVLWRKAEEIFRRSGYKEDVLLADITGGTKMMSVALAMACIPPLRKMQYMDTMRDWQGQPLPAHTSQPVVIDVDPLLYEPE
jgi:hypothetical protein